MDAISFMETLRVLCSVFLYLCCMVPCYMVLLNISSPAKRKRYRPPSRESTSSSSGQDREIRLTSIKNLRKSIDEKEHPALKDLLEDHIFVGCVDRSQALIQHSTKLYLVNTTRLTKELFYQIIIFKFGNFGYMRLTNPAPIYDLALMALKHEQSGWTQSDGPKEELAKYVTDLLKSKAEMLLDYFSMEIDGDGNLTAIPLLLERYSPDLFRLPMFLLKMATDVSRPAYILIALASPESQQAGVQRLDLF